MDQGRQAGGELDRSFLSSVAGESSTFKLSVIAYDLGNIWRRSASPKKIGNWSLTVADKFAAGAAFVQLLP